MVSKKTIAGLGFACVSLFNSVGAEAGGFDITKINSNAVAETLVQAVLIDAKQDSAATTYVSSEEASLVCVGKIPLTKIDTFDSNGQKMFMEPFDSKLAEFIKSPDVKDKAAQAKLKSIVESRDDLAFVQYTTTGGPDEKLVTDYFKKLGKAPIDVFNYGTDTRDGSKTTTILLDKSTFDQFVAVNKGALNKLHTKYTTDNYGPRTWSACGPANK